MEYDRVTTAFSIGKKIVRLITDNASNNLSAFGELVIPGFESYFVSEDDVGNSDDDSIETNLNMSEGHCPDDDDNVSDEFDKGEELLRLPCFVHTLQLSVKDDLKESACTRSPMAKVAEIAKLSHKSISIAEKLQEFKLSMSGSPSIYLIYRWTILSSSLSSSVCVRLCPVYVLLSLLLLSSRPRVCSLVCVCVSCRCCSSFLCGCSLSLLFLCGISGVCFFLFDLVLGLFWVFLSILFFCGFIRSLFENKGRA
jgi:hypothetical protein